MAKSIAELKQISLQDAYNRIMIEINDRTARAKELVNTAAPKQDVREILMKLKQAENRLSEHGIYMTLAEEYYITAAKFKEDE